MSSYEVTELSSGQKNRLLALLVPGHGIAHWYNGMLSVLYPVLTVSLGLTFSQVALFDSSRGIVAVVTSLLGGYTADTMDRRRVFLGFSLISLGVFTFFLSFANGFPTALLWLALGGIGNSLWHPYAIPMLGNVFSRRKGLALSLHDASANILHGLAPIIIGFLLTLFAWQAVVRLQLWPGVIVGVLVLVALPIVQMRRKGVVGQLSYRQSWQSGILRNRALLMAVGVSVSLTMARILLFTFLPLYLAFELGLDSARQGLYMGALTISGALLGPAAGSLADRIGTSIVLTFALSVAAVVVLALPSAEAGPYLWLAIIVLGGAVFSTRSLILVSVINVTPPEIGGSSIGAIFSINRLFGILSPLIAGVIADRFGLGYVFYWMGALLIVGVGLTLLMRRSQKRGEKMPQSE